MEQNSNAAVGAKKTNTKIKINIRNTKTHKKKHKNRQHPGKQKIEKTY